MLVNGAPQKPMLRDSNEKTSAKSQRPEDLPQHDLILGDMFENVERSDGVELMLERELARIHLIQINTGQTRPCKGETIAENLASRQTETRRGFPKAFKNKSGSAANFQETFGIWEVRAKRPLNELVARAKPEVAFLNTREFCKVLRFESVVGRGLGKTQRLVLRDWPIPALRTLPSVVLEATRARQAAFHLPFNPAAIYERSVLRLRLSSRVFASPCQLDSGGRALVRRGDWRTSAPFLSLRK